LLAGRHLAYLYDTLGERPRAETLHEENLRGARESGNDRFAASSLSALGSYALNDDRVGDAIQLLEESLALHRELGDVLDTAVDLSLLASALARAGRVETATTVASALEATGHEIGVRGEAVRARTAETLVAARDALDAQTFDEAAERGQTLTLRDAVASALDELRHAR
jgi:tetratricopeptide (TPR) repeat protein